MGGKRARRRAPRHRDQLAKPDPTYDLWDQVNCHHNPDGLVVAERDRGAAPTRRGLGEARGEPEMAQPTDRGVAPDRPPVDVGLRDLLWHVLERSGGYLATSDWRWSGLCSLTSCQVEP